MAHFAVFSIGRDGEWQEHNTFAEAKQGAGEYYRSMGCDAEETVILMIEANTLQKAWEKNSNSKWIRIRNESELKRYSKEVVQ